MNINYKDQEIDVSKEIQKYKDLTINEILSNKRLPNEEFAVYRARLKFVSDYMKRKKRGIPVNK